MHDPLPVRCFQRFGHGNSDSENFADWHRSFRQSLRESLSFQQLHHEVLGAILRADIVKMADVRMVERGNRLGLALHTLLQFGGRGQMRSQDFDGYGTVETGVPGAVYLSHSPFTERRLNFVGTEFCARGEGHARVGL